MLLPSCSLTETLYPQSTRTSSRDEGEQKTRPKVDGDVLRNLRDHRENLLAKIGLREQNDYSYASGSLRTGPVSDLHPDKVGTATHTTTSITLSVPVSRLCSLRDYYSTVSDSHVPVCTTSRKTQSVFR